MKTLISIKTTIILSLFVMIGCSATTYANNIKLNTESSGLLSDVPCPSPKWGKDSLKTVENLSLYKQFYKQKNYPEALKTWRYVFHTAPGSVEYALIDGSVIFKTMIRNQKDKALRKPLIDTLMMIYNKRLACFGETGNILGRKASDMISLLPDEREKAYELFTKAIELDGDKTSYQIMYSYIFNTIQLRLKGIIDTAEVIANYNQALSILEANKKDLRNAKKTG